MCVGGGTPLINLSTQKAEVGGPWAQGQSESHCLQKPMDGRRRKLRFLRGGGGTEKGKKLAGCIVFYCPASVSPFPMHAI